MFNLSKSLYGRPADCVLIAFAVYASVLIDMSLKFTCLLSFKGSVTLFPCEDYTFYLINLARDLPTFNHPSLLLIQYSDSTYWLLVCNE